MYHILQTISKVIFTEIHKSRGTTEKLVKYNIELGLPDIVF